jgi:hypothetical protein
VGPVPDLDEDFEPPRVAFSIARTGPSRFTAAVGGFWEKHKDEYGRAGLVYWHGVVCEIASFGPKEASELADLLVGLAQRLESSYEAIGEVIVGVADGRADPG